MHNLAFLDETHALPAPHGRVVEWRIFRDRRRAHSFAANVVVMAGERIVGGYASDSVGELWWVGVEVDGQPAVERHGPYLDRAERRSRVRLSGE